MNSIDSIFINFPELETERFILRQVTAKDSKDLYELYSDPLAVKYQQSETMSDMEQAKKTVIAFLKGYSNKNFIRWCISDKLTDKVVGLISLHSFDIFNFKSEIGYMLNSKYLNQNIMTECAIKVLDFAFNIIKLTKVEASINPDNKRSIHLVVKLGFKEELLIKGISFNFKTALFEDRVIFALQKDQYHL
ncbi:GNAT family N-acetyltransferase [Clostridium folliculivorans]|uniref:Alanine acetyltransferase n=1 Tax=Clostridium folliculivorans TaxID=2886038 RepID=A0A9W5XZR3_9CLOT|nr:GNAT family N-acetyltransferase [Clostridium folliculivorans]GKU23920.1 alanine acetyltransferase [Clostridium folliculivorans]GKU30035.1 alanine acetyltransferase [Clostridium folliculivorans]